jgi:hypothetical protein
MKKKNKHTYKFEEKKWTSWVLILKFQNALNMVQYWMALTQIPY